MEGFEVFRARTPAEKLRKGQNMTETEKTTPTRQALAAKDRSAPGRVSGRLKIAIDRLVWFGDRRADAAAAAGLSDHGLRAALRKGHVLAHLRAELALLREGERPRNVHRLAALRDQDENRGAAVKAIQVLEQLTENETQYTPRQGPFFTIIVVDDSGKPLPVQPAEVQGKVIEHAPIARELEDEGN
jgi:hypothetical protein